MPAFFFVFPHCASPTEETDLRFTYCALAIHYILQGKRGDVVSDFSMEKAVDFVKNCQSYQGGFGQTPGLEAHGGSTYCAVASLVMSGAEIPNEGKLVQWLMLRQERVVDRDVPSCGFNGRSNKIADSCYTFWVGSCLGMLVEGVGNKILNFKFCVSNFAFTHFKYLFMAIISFFSLQTSNFTCRLASSAFSFFLAQENPTTATTLPKIALPIAKFSIPSALESVLFLEFF